MIAGSRQFLTDRFIFSMRLINKILTSFCWLYFVPLYAVLVAVVLLTPQTMVEAITTQSVRGFNKQIHAMLFFPLAFGLVTLLPRVWELRQRAVLGAVAAAAYGAVLEALQGLLPVLQRGFNWADILANCIGAAGGALGAAWLIRLSAKPTSRDLRISSEHG